MVRCNVEWLNPLLANASRNVVPSGNAHAPNYLLVGSDRGIFYGLPWYLEGFRPDGFTGRNFVQHWARVLGAPDDLRNWASDDILAAAVAGLTDAPGNWLIGAEPSQQSLRLVVPNSERMRNLRATQLLANPWAPARVESSPSSRH